MKVTVARGAVSLSGTFGRPQDVIILKKRVAVIEGVIAINSVLGALDSVGGIVTPITLKKVSETESMTALRVGTKGLILKHDLPPTTLDFPAYKVMQAGAELISLGRFEVDQEYLLEIAKFARKKGYRTSLGVFARVPDDPSKVRVLKDVPITDPEEAEC